MSAVTQEVEMPREGADYLTVSIDDDLFAIPVDLVHEVLDPPAVTLVPTRRTSRPASSTCAATSCRSSTCAAASGWGAPPTPSIPA